MIDESRTGKDLEGSSCGLSGYYNNFYRQNLGKPQKPVRRARVLDEI
jgi:hypothetical protein